MVITTSSWGWDDIKTEFEGQMSELLPHSNAQFRLVTLEEWRGQCPSPGKKALNTGKIEHRTHESTVCLDCYKIYVRTLDLPLMSREEISNVTSFIAQQYHKRISLQ